MQVHEDGAVELALDGTTLGLLRPGLVEIDRRPLTADGEVLTGEEPTVRTRIGTTTVTWWARRQDEHAVWEIGLDLRNEGSEPMLLTRLDPLLLELQPELGHWTTTWYRSAWGDEFRPRHGTTRHDVVLDVRSGRSSHGHSPWLGLEAEDHPAAIVISPAWSGNWWINALAHGRISAGISPWQLGIELAPGETLSAPSVVLAVGTTTDEAALTLQRAVRDRWLARSPWSDSAPPEWNHWWPYEDQEVDEAVIGANADVAATLGLPVVTIDAGWFGAADAASDWQEQRGDWDLVNTARFPSGLAAVGDRIRAAGAEPGIWIEAEAVGRSALVRRQRPEILALATDGRRHDPSYRVTTVSLDDDDPTFLGYACLGSPAGRSHVLESMSRLVTTIGARWVKLDFNVDPDAGCTRTDHGHGAGEGLFRHYLGLYAVLDEFRSRHPDVLLEACSSGGLRIDLGLARHIHGFFLSDPDWTEHHLQVLWGAARMLPPLGILHWSQSQWRGDHPQQRVDWATLAPERFDTMLRAAMLHRFGVSIRLPDLAPALHERLALHVRFYREHVAPLLPTAVLRTLTAAPGRGGSGERRPAAQLSDEERDVHVLGAFDLDGTGAPVLGVQGLDTRRRYRVRHAGHDPVVLPGAELASAVPLDASTGQTSWLLLIEPVED
ncbi:hypothetical protein GCM10027067_14490 [Pseudactinotalea suaedae]